MKVQMEKLTVEFWPRAFIHRVCTLHFSISVVRSEDLYDQEDCLLN